MNSPDRPPFRAVGRAVLAWGIAAVLAYVALRVALPAEGERRTLDGLNEALGGIFACLALGAIAALCALVAFVLTLRRGRQLSEVQRIVGVTPFLLSIAGVAAFWIAARLRATVPAGETTPPPTSAPTDAR